MTHELDPLDLDRFEIGYDRHYVGVGLHCLECPTDDYEDVSDELNGMTLAAVVELARRHQANQHRKSR